jgi:hypothetical protein
VLSTKNQRNKTTQKHLHAFTPLQKTKETKGHKPTALFLLKLPIKERPPIACI